MSNSIGAKLKHLTAAAKLTPAQFAAEFASAQGVRKSVVEAWLEDERAVYGANLKKLASYWKATFPTITASHFMMPLDDFVRSFEPARSGQSEIGVVLPMHINPLSGPQLNALTGSYRLYRYSLSPTPTIVCEAVSIFPEPSPQSNNAPGLRAELRSPLAKGVQKFVGTVVALGDRIYLLLSDVDATSSAMRFISLHGRFERKKHVVGVMSGAFDRDQTISYVTVAMRKDAPDHTQARDDASWLSLDAYDDVDKELVFDLSMTKSIKTT